MGYRGMIDLARRSPYGERGLKYHLTTIAQSANRRSPYGERGLKYRRDIPVQRGCESLSLRRAWIEITSRPLPPPTRSSLSLRRAWIEITIRPFVIGWPCRSPYGERGLKFGAPAEPERDDASLSLRRAWIEISRSQAT